MRLVEPLAKCTMNRLLELLANVIVTFQACIFQDGGHRVLTCDGVRVVTGRAFGKVARALSGQSAVNTDVVTCVSSSTPSLRRVHPIMALCAGLVYAICGKHGAGSLGRENVMLAVTTRALQRTLMSSSGHLCRGLGVTACAVDRLESLFMRKVIETL